MKAEMHLAEIDRRVWTKGGDNDWLDLQVYLGQLQVALRVAGVPQRLIDDLSDSASAHWQAVEDSGHDEIGWWVTGNETEELQASKGRVLDWLDRPWKVLSRWRAFRAVPRDPGREIAH